jgi:rSAM/selenodomain-associated transferase 2
MLVSVVIPVLAGDQALEQILDQLHAQADVEIIVSIAGHSDTRALREARPDVRWIDAPIGRGSQLNAGAARATGRWLWFVHADSQLPPRWVEVFRALEDRQGDQGEPSGERRDSPSVVGGSFSFRLDSDAWQARVIEAGVRWRVRLFSLPYGDQGLFVRRSVFEQMGGFADIPLMEDVEFIRRLKGRGRVRHLNLYLGTSARRWERDGWFRRSALNLTFLMLYALGASPDWLSRRYNRG